jgi:hypothetical protein
MSSSSHSFSSFSARPSRPRRWFLLSALSLPIAGAWLAGCSASDLVKVDHSTDSTVATSTVKSYAGAVGMYAAAIGQMEIAFNQYAATSGIFTDEMTSSTNADLDGRILQNVNSGTVSANTYAAVQRARSLAQYAAGALQYYGTSATRPMIGEMYALEGYSEVLLAELYCSGVPLTVTAFNKDFVYTRGFSTTEILHQAIAHFDTAYTYGSDSLPVATAAQVGKGRALLDLGQYTDAATAVANVPLTAVYGLEYQGAWWTQNGVDTTNYSYPAQETSNSMNWLNGAGQSTDPRVPMSTSPVLTQNKYPISPTVLMTAHLADGIEAKLIQAEAELQPAASPSGPWLATLNQLRETVSLSDTTDPGTVDSRVDLLFRERAYWFYLTGHRQGDLRRLIRQYGRFQQQVYPYGLYDAGLAMFSFYGTNVVLPPPVSEQQENTLYTGCIDRNA